MRGTLFTLLLTVCAPPLRGAEPPIDFTTHVLPILKTHCHECHDAKKQTASFRLDVRRIAFEGGESGTAAIVPGDPDKSELIHRITTGDEFTRMPPEGEPLTADQIAILKTWIAQGAVWPDSHAGDDPRLVSHWAFQSPVRPPIPQIDSARLKQPIDHFVLARLRSEGLDFSPEADKTTLIRRLTLDLTGLPPTPAEVDAFLADTHPDAYSRLVERLLASPHYGERWGRVWLDAARYADSDGYEKDKPRFAYFYRDYVINALNRDLPYNQFIIEQIAGDLLPSATQDQRVATGFLRNSMVNEEGGIDPEQFRMEAMFDRIDAIGKSILGLTVQCSQCHDHKFDPISQKEYFEIFAFINNGHEANIAVYTEPELRKRESIQEQTQRIETELKTAFSDWPARMADWEQSARGNQPAWAIVRPELDESGGQKHRLLEDGSVLAEGYAPSKHTTSFTGKTDATSVTAVRLELLNDPTLPAGGPGRSIEGLFALTEFRVTAGPADGSAPSKPVKIASVTADAEQEKTPLAPLYDDKSGKERFVGPIAYATDGNNETAWGINVGAGRSNVPRQAVFVLEEPLTFPSGVALTFDLVQNHGGWNSNDNQNQNPGRFRFAVTAAPEAAADPVPREVRQIIENTTSETRTPEQQALVFSFWRTQVPDFEAFNARIREVWKSHPTGATQLVMAERQELRPTHLLKRGDFLSPGEQVHPAVPEVLHDLPPSDSEGHTRNRLDFARWLASPDSPTTARALVNRVWQQYFGIGIVETSEDLGTQAAEPSHPGLLDWLAVEFMEQGWSLKELHRRIVLSTTYRQSSHVSPELLSRDPYNRLLARGARFRMEAESIRDIALAASGLLNQDVGGPSVYPSMPQFLLEPPVSYGLKTWPFETGANRYRRAVYTFRYRSVPYPMLDIFDAPPGNTSCVRRTQSNTPLQALVALNEPVFLACARNLAAQTLARDAGDNAERLTFAFRRCLARRPTPEEQAELLKLFTDQRKRFAEGQLEPWALAAEDPANPPALPEGAQPADLAAWTVVARVLLNLDETITRE